MSLISMVAPTNWEGEVKEDKGVLVFDKSGALLGGGVIGSIEGGANIIARRWIVPLAGDDWVKRQDQEDDLNLNIEIVSELTANCMQATLAQITRVWAEQDAVWAGRLEGVLHVVDHLGIKVEQREAKEPVKAQEEVQEEVKQEVLEPNQPIGLVYEEVDAAGKSHIVGA